jgi:4a-hydroxytetrahydrobiopterin dehydratase
MNELAAKHCKPCEGGIAPIEGHEAERLLLSLPGWSLTADSAQISRIYQFNTYYETMAFVNALAWIAHQEDHHPDLRVGWNRCEVHYTTHAIGGLSENDFICAAKVNAVIMAPPSM